MDEFLKFKARNDDLTSPFIFVFPHLPQWKPSSEKNLLPLTNEEKASNRIMGKRQEEALHRRRNTQDP